MNHIHWRKTYGRLDCQEIPSFVWNVQFGTRLCGSSAGGGGGGGGGGEGGGGEEVGWVVREMRGGIREHLIAAATSGHNVVYLLQGPVVVQHC